jgi:hypothetical protein
VRHHGDEVPQRNADRGEHGEHRTEEQGAGVAGTIDGFGRTAIDPAPKAVKKTMSLGG